MKRTFIMVLDSFGIGASEDAERFGDRGSDTRATSPRFARAVRPMWAAGPLTLPNLSRLGLGKAAEESTGNRGWTATPTSSALTLTPASSLPVKTRRRATGKSPACRCCSTGATSRTSTTASRRHCWTSWSSAPSCRVTGQLPLVRHRDPRSAGRRAHENRQADFLHLRRLSVPDRLP